MVFSGDGPIANHYRLENVFKNPTTLLFTLHKENAISEKKKLNVRKFSNA